LRFWDTPRRNREVQTSETGAGKRGAPEQRSLLTLKRGLTILEVLAAAPTAAGLSHAALGTHLQLQRSTLYRYLACLEECGFVEETEDHRYRLGSRILALAAGVHSRLFADAAGEFVAELAAETGETAHATVYDHPESITIHIAEGSGAVGPRISVGSRRVAHSCASGKVFLAYQPASVVDAYLAGALEARTPATLTSPSALRRLLADVRERGYATDEGESYEGISGLSAPVRDSSGAVVGALCLTVAARRLGRARTRALAEPLTLAAARLSRLLGHVPPDARA
jgi:DNA-binding IclR family transcriptional regulator